MGNIPSHWVPTEAAWAGPSSSMASKLWLGLSIRHKRHVGKTPPQAGVRAGPNGHASSLTPESPSRAQRPSLSQSPTGDGGPSSYGKPRPSLLSGWAQQEKRPRGKEESGGHRKERSTRLNRNRSCCLSSLQAPCPRGSPRFLVGGTDPHRPSHCRSGRPW